MSLCSCFRFNANKQNQVHEQSKCGLCTNPKNRQYEALSPDNTSVLESEYQGILSLDYHSPPPYTESALSPQAAEDDKGPVPAPTGPISMPEIRPVSASDEIESNGQAVSDDPDAVELQKPPPQADNAVHNSSVLPSNYSAEDEVNEFVQEQDASRAKKKTAATVMAGVIAGTCVFEFGSLVYERRKDSK